MVTPSIARLDGQPVAISGYGTNEFCWRAQMEVTAGAHKLTAATRHPSGQFTAEAANSFACANANQIAVDTYNNAGNFTQRVWKNGSGTTNRIQSIRIGNPE